jgi:hypothetical protein
VNEAGIVVSSAEAGEAINGIVMDTSNIARKLVANSFFVFFTVFHRK